MNRILCLLLVFILGMQPCYCGFFNKSKQKKQEKKEPKEHNEQLEKTTPPERTSDIPVYDKIDKLIEKRQKEAYELIAEGRKLIKKGEKRNNINLIKKGKIKKEIGEKQLLLLKEQAEQNRLRNKVTSGKNRHPMLFARSNSAVLLVDYQERFVPVLQDNENTVKNIKLLLAGANIYSVPVFVSEQVPEKLGSTIKDFDPYLNNAWHFSKKAMSCCGETKFIQELKSRKIEKIAVCGIEAHVCVLQTSLDLLHNNFQVHLICDAITTRIAHNKGIAIKKIGSAGAVITSVETVLFEIAYEAGSEEFKKIAATV